MNIYLAGPMRGYPLYNFQAFFDAAIALKGQQLGRMLRPNQ